MQRTSAPNIGEAPLPQRARSYWKTRFSALQEELEKLLEAERAQLPPWLVVGFGSGIAAWFALGRPVEWAAFLCLAAGLGISGFVAGSERSGRALGWFALAAGLGCALVWARAEWVSSPRLERPVTPAFEARRGRVEPMVAKGTVRLTLAPGDPALPPRVRVSVDADKTPAGLVGGSTVRLRARLMPPAPMAVPGTYDFARDAGFRGIGAVGKSPGTVELVRAGPGGGLDSVRQRLGEDIPSPLHGS